MREPPKIAEEQLRMCLRKEYGLTPARLDFLALGLDYSAGVYRVECSPGAAYLLKVKAGPLYEPAYLVPHYLNERGIASVVAPLPTRSQRLWTALESWTLLIYPYLEGNTEWRGMTAEQWRKVGGTFKRIHETSLPPSGFPSLRQEAFDPAIYKRSVQALEARYLQSPKDGEGPSADTLRACWLTHQDTISHIVTTLEKLAHSPHLHALPRVICHADLHPANLLRTPSGQVYVIDWDEVMLAPRERDFIFVGEALPSRSAPLASSPFFEGYGNIDIDWFALTYFLYERVIQDLLECARTVFSRDDLTETSKADEAQLFEAILSEEGELTSAIAAAAHLPAEFQ